MQVPTRNPENLIKLKAKFGTSKTKEKSTRPIHPLMEATAEDSKNIKKRPRDKERDR